MKIVDDGAAFLDEVSPGWADKINLDTLDMSSHCNCVLGQIYRREHPRVRLVSQSYYRQVQAFGLDTPERNRTWRAFYAWRRVRYDNLTAAWRREIQKRRGKS